MVITGKLSRQARLVNQFLSIMLKLGIFDTTRYVHPSLLTVLNYHRIDDATRPGFDSFSPNVTASPTEFARQMDYLQHHYNVITSEHLSAWLYGKRELPPYSALITFDDGYYDNFAHAYPILRERNLPAIIFLTTGLIGKDTPFYWDYVAYCFYHTSRKSAKLPLLQSVAWTGEGERRRIMQRWIEVVKQLPDKQKQRLIETLREILDVNVPERVFSNLYLTWDQVREMSRNGIEMGSHTVGHPILTCIPLSLVEDELKNSRQRIESEIGKSVIGFAYPNGSLSDFSPEIMDLVRQTGYEVAFTLVSGPTRYSEVRRNPLAIRRIFLGSSDVFPRFVAKLTWGRYLSI